MRVHTLLSFCARVVLTQRLTLIPTAATFSRPTHTPVCSSSRASGPTAVRAIGSGERRGKRRDGSGGVAEAPRRRDEMAKSRDDGADDPDGGE